MRARKTWIATFNGAECRVFEYEGAPRRLVEVDGAHLSGAHKPDFADRATRVFSSASPRRSAAEPRTDAERALEDAFVAEVAEFLALAAKAESFDDLVIAAGPRALGAFRKAAPKTVSDRVKRELHADLVGSSPPEILAAVQAD
jgi:protein required for attachment to host cells